MISYSKKQRTKNIFRQIVGISLFFMMLIPSLLSAQEQEHMPDFPIDELVRMQIDAMQMQDINMLMMAYHREIELVTFPSKVIASGYDAVKEYWVKKVDSKEVVEYQFQDVIKVGDTYVATVLKIKPELNYSAKVVFIFEFDKKKIRKIYYLLN